MTLLGPPGTRLSHWYVVFTDASHYGGNKHWLRYCRPGYRHVMLTRYDGGGRWQIVSSHARALEVATLPNFGDYVRWLYEQGAKVLVFRQWRRPEQPRRQMMNCVTTTAHVLGVRVPWHVVTPWRLSRYLVSQGATEYKP